MKKIIFLIILLFCLESVKALEGKKVIDVTLEKCVDGDTADFLYEDKTLKARFLAIDTPETKHPTKKEEPFGKEASEYTCNSLSKAKVITLVYDENSDELDKYNRHLVWVYYDNNFLQEELLEKGLAKVAYLYGNYSRTEKLQQIEKAAQRNQAGIWGDYVDYTLYYIIGGILLLIVIAIIISKTKNKNIKSAANTASREITKNLRSLIRKKF